MCVSRLQQPGELGRNIEETNALARRKAEDGGVKVARRNIHHQNNLVRREVVLEMFDQTTHGLPHEGVAVPRRLSPPQVEVFWEMWSDIFQRLLWNLVFVADKYLWQLQLNGCIMRHECQE